MRYISEPKGTQIILYNYKDFSLEFKKCMDFSFLNNKGCTPRNNDNVTFKSRRKQMEILNQRMILQKDMYQKFLNYSTKIYSELSNELILYLVEPQTKFQKEQLKKLQQRQIKLSYLVDDYISKIDSINNLESNIEWIIRLPYRECQELLMKKFPDSIKFIGRIIYLEKCLYLKCFLKYSDRVSCL